MSLAILAFFSIAFILVFVLRLARIGTLLALLLAGVVAGPHVLGLFNVSTGWHYLGEIGIIFLWFTMGLEINMRRLWQMRRNIFGFGAAQVMMVVVMLFPILFGLTTWSIMGTVMVALLLSMSSTSTDLEILADRNELQSGTGRQIFSILLFQDLLSIPLLAMLPIFAGRSINLGADVIDILVMSVGLILGVVIVGRFLLNPLMKLVSKLKSKEAFLIAIMLNIILWVVLLEYVGLPAALGAFLAGMLLSETVYRHQVSAEISPYAMLFLSFFFIALGMGLDLKLLGEKWVIIAGGVFALMFIKFIAIFMVARVRHLNSSQAFMISLILAQGGEFGLLILQTLKTNNIEAIPFVHAEILTAIIIVSIMMTPLLMAVYDRMRKSGKLFANLHSKKLNELVNTSKPEVMICGFGRVGQTVAKILDSKNIPYVAVDYSVNTVLMGQEHKFNVFYGDTTNTNILENMGLGHGIKSVVIALDNAAIAKHTVRAIKQVSPRMKIFARARNMTETKILLDEGVKTALPETVESSFLLGGDVLENLGISKAAIDKILDKMRANNYKELEDINI